MKSLLLFSSLVATSLSAAVPRNAVPEPAPQVLGSPTRTVEESPTPFPWWNWWPPHATDTPPRITSFPREAAPEPEPQVLGSPSRTLQVAPTPPFPWWPWAGWPSATPVDTVPRNAAPEPQVLGSPSRTLQEAPTPPFPWWWNGWPSATPVDTVPRNAAPEPQVLGSPSRTNQVLPTPPFPWWWNQWPGATPAAVNEREVDEKREPQTLNFGSSRTVQIGPHPTVVPHPPGHKHTSSPYEIDETLTLPALTLDKRDPQTLDWTISRTNEITPTGPVTHHHHPTTVSTVYVTITENPYEIDATLTLEPLTLNKKREPQTLGPISRTVEISPTGPSKHHHTPVSTVYVTVTEYEPVDKKRAPQTLDLGSRTTEVFPTPTPLYYTTFTLTTETITKMNKTQTTVETVYLTKPFPTSAVPTGTEINIPLTLPYDPLQTIIGKEKRVAEANPARPTSPPKENPCQNNIFAPPAWCFSPTSVVTVTVTVTTTPSVSASATPSITAISTATNLFETTVTLPPVTLTAGTPPWTRKERRSRQRI